MTELTIEDIAVLAPCVLEEIAQVFKFKRGEVVMGPGLEEEVHASFPKTMAKRAYEAIAGGEPVWDRVNNQIWLPLGLNSGSTTVGAMTFKGVERTVVPEEGARWLPVLSSLVHSTYVVAKQRCLRSHSRGLPVYLSLLMRFQGGAMAYPALSYILYCETGSRCQGEPPARVFKRALFCGSAQGNGSWWLVEGEVKKIPIYFERLLKAGAKKVFLFHRRRYTSVEALLTDKGGLEEASRRLGLRCLAPEVFDRLKAKAGVGDVARFFNILEKELSGRRHGKVCCIVGVHGVDDERALSLDPLDRLGAMSIFRSQELALYAFCGSGLDGVRDHFCHHAEVHGCKVSITRVKDIGPRHEVLKALFWAGVHGSLLDPGSVFETGSITYQVAGDECFAHGDIQAATRYFRGAVRLDQGNVEALNSLGVSLARLGRRKPAKDSFMKAIENAPDDSMGYYNLGCLLMDSMDIEGALTALSTAHANSPRDPLILARYLEALLEARADEEAKNALEGLEPLVKKGPPQPWVTRVVARARFFLGDAHGASRAARKVLSMRPNDPEALYLCAATLEMNEGESEALEKVINEIDPKKIASRRLKEHYFLFNKKR